MANDKQNESATKNLLDGLTDWLKPYLIGREITGEQWQKLSNYILAARDELAAKDAEIERLVEEAKQNRYIHLSHRNAQQAAEIERLRAELAAIYANPSLAWKGTGCIEISEEARGAALSANEKEHTE